MIRVVQIIFWRWSSNIPLFVEINFIFAVHHCPNSDIEFALFVQQGFFKVFLNYTKCTCRSRIYESQHFIKFWKYLDASALVHVCRFYEPKVFLAVLHWETLFGSEAFGDLEVSLYQLLLLLIFDPSLYQKSGGCCVKLCVPTLFGLDILVIIMSQRPYESTLGTYWLQAFKMVKN